MFRKRINTGLLILLITAVIFMSSGCQKLSVNKLKANYYFTKANHQFTDQKYRMAIEEYEKALEYNPNLIEAYRFLGESYKSIFRSGDKTEANKLRAEKALEALKKAHEIDPTNKDVIYSLGDMYDKMRDFEEAEKLYLMIIEMEPTNMSNYYVAAEFYKRYAGGSGEEKEGEEKVGKTPAQKAVEMYLRRIETDPENEQGYAYIAQYYETLSPVPEFELGYEYHMRRVELDPENAKAWLSVGVNRWSKTFRLQNELSRNVRLALAKQSEEALKKANDLDPSYPEPYSWLSVLYKSVLAKIDPDRAQRYEDMADRYIQRYQEAQKRKVQREKLAEELSGEH